jgi:serine/threonine protein kinase
MVTNPSYPVRMIKEVGDVRVMFELLSGRYYLEGSLGDGDMAAHCAVDTYTDDAVLIVFGQRPVVSGQRSLDARFKTQVEKAGRLRHPNIASLIEIGEDLGAAYFVFARPKGRTLGQLLGRNKTLRAGDALQALDGVAAALDFAHSHGVTHGALDVSNVIVSPDFAARLTGFGASAACVESSDATVRGDLSAFAQLASRLLAAHPAYAAVLAALKTPASARALIDAVRAVAPPQVLTSGTGFGSGIKRAAVAMFAVGAVVIGVAATGYGGQAIDVLSIAASAAQQIAAK